MIKYFDSKHWTEFLVKAAEEKQPAGPTSREIDNTDYAD